MEKIIKEYKGVIIFYLIIILSIFIISTKNAKLNSTSKVANYNNIKVNFEK